MDDSQLLENYVGGSQQAMDDLVRRNIDWVYSSALRQTRDPHDADDVTQAVFLLLTQKAQKLCGHPRLAGWLFRSTRHIASQARRAARRRQLHEAKAREMNPVSTLPGDRDDEPLSSHLDELIARLPRPDRDLVLQRFFQRKTFAEIGQYAGVSEDAARKRVNRALEELRQMFDRRGIASAALPVEAYLEQQGVHPAPARLTGSVLNSIANPQPNPLLRRVARRTFVFRSLTAASLLIPLGALALLFTRPARLPIVSEVKPPLKVGIVCSLSHAKSRSARGGFQSADIMARQLTDDKTDLYAILEPGTQDDPLVQQLLAARFKPGHWLDGSDPQAIAKVQVVVSNKQWVLDPSVCAAIARSVEVNGTGVLTHSALGTELPGLDNPDVQHLNTMKDGGAFYFPGPQACQVVSDHPLVLTLKGDSQGAGATFVDKNPWGSFGEFLPHTTLIEAVIPPRSNAYDAGLAEALGRANGTTPSTRSALRIPLLYTATLGKGSIIVCTWGAFPPAQLELPHHNRFYIHTCQWLAHREMD